MATALAAPSPMMMRVVDYYWSTYYKAVRVGGRGIVEDMCYEILRGALCGVCEYSLHYYRLAAGLR
jgi:hypothetical protein